MVYLVILLSAAVSGYMGSLLAKWRCWQNASILAGVIVAFGFYILAWVGLDLVMDVDDESMGMMLAFGFPGLILFFAAAGWLGYRYSARTRTG